MNDIARVNVEIVEPPKNRSQHYYTILKFLTVI